MGCGASPPHPLPNYRKKNKLTATLGACHCGDEQEGPDRPDMGPSCFPQAEHLELTSIQEVSRREKTHWTWKKWPAAQITELTMENNVFCAISKQ